MGQGRAIFGCSGLILTETERRFFRDADPWGFILFARNVDNPDQLCRLTTALRESVGREAPVLIDQEGGRVARMRAPHWREWLPPLEEVSRLGVNCVRGMYLRYRIIANELRAVGIDVNCTPCADLAVPDTHPVLRNRCYGDDVDDVVKVGRSVAQGLLDGGVLPVVKHMPGHGRATQDSHKELPRVSASAQELQRTDFAAFAGLNDLPLGMSAHIVFEDFGQEGPATTSFDMIGLIRDEIGFQGLLMTDDLSMQALSGTMAERSRAALDAGIDLILHCNGELTEMQAVAAEAGMFDNISQHRADQALAQRKVPDAVDIAALEAEFHALTRVGADG